MRALLRLALLLSLPVTAFAASPPTTPSPSAYCDAAIAGAERSLSLPSRVLSAIAEIESGRLNAETGTLHPWPWTINAEGRGQFFETKAQAIAAVRALQAQGMRSIDVGCMQVNLMYHPNAFSSLDDAFDPEANARYAARFLNTLYSTSGSWLQAIAAYHSETPAIGADYRRRVMARLELPATRALVGFPSVQAAYRDFAPGNQVYGAFRSPDRAYGAFAEPIPVAARLAHR